VNQSNARQKISIKLRESKFLGEDSRHAIIV
jgi:hypothetical protein